MSTQAAGEFISFVAHTTPGGYAIEGFDQGTDVISFEGYGSNPTITREGDGLGDFRITAADGSYDTFHLEGVETLNASDYVFRDAPTPTEQPEAGADPARGELISFVANTTPGGYAIKGFDQGTDVISFEGYGSNPTITREGDGLGDFRITAANGSYDTFHLEGVETLNAHDYIFRDIPAPAQQPNAQPAPVEPPPSEHDYTVVLADDFSDGYQTTKWGDPFDGGTYWNGAFEWSAEDVAVRDGELQVTATRHEDGSWTAGGFSSFKAGQTITYGTVEFDARVEQAQGTQAAILMWPVSDIWPRDGEIDILETPKQVAMHSSHWEGSDGSHQYSSIFSDVDVDATNHYKMTWLPDQLTIEVNGKVVAEWTDPAAIPDTAMGFGAMGYVAAVGEEWLGDAPDGSTPDVITTHIDNVVMSQWNGIA